MADEQESNFRLRLQDDVSGAADTMRGALSELKSQMEADTKSLTALNKAMSTMKAAGVSTGQQYVQIKKAIDAKRVSLAKAQKEYLNLGGSIQSLARKTPQVASGFQQILQQASRMRGPIGTLAGMFQKLVAFVAENKLAAGLLAVAAGIAAVTVAGTKAIANLYQYATAQANARRSELLRLEGLSKIRTYLTMAYGLKATDPKQMQASIDRVSASVSINRGEVERWNEQLYKAGLRGRQLDLALEGVSITASAQGTEQANLFASWAQGYALTGRSVEGMTNRVKTRLGGTVAKMMLDSNVQAEKLQESYAAMFRGLDSEELLKAKAQFNALFSQSTASGRALSRLLTNLVKVLADGMVFFQKTLTTAVEIGVVGFLRLENIVLKTRLAFRLFGLVARNVLTQLVIDVRDLKDGVIKIAQDMSAALLGELDKPFREMHAAIQIAIASIGAFAAKLSVAAYPAVAQFTRQLLFTTIPAILQTARTFITTTIPAVARFAWSLILQAGPAILTFARTLYSSAVPALISFVRWSGAAIVRMALMAWPILLAVAAVWGLIKIVELLYVVWKEIDWKDLGRSILKGIGEGISSSVDWLLDTMSGVAVKLKNVFKGALGISSPSKVFAELGRGIPAGLQLGIEEGTNGVAATVKSMVAGTPGATPNGGAPASPAAGTSQPSAAAAKGGGGGNTVTITIRELHAHAGGGGNASQSRDLALSVKAELERVLQGVLIEMGATAR